jgi:UDP-glucose:tetrahydrobiopterin glucosyltransferase
MRSPLNILFLSTSVGPLGSGLGGGVELTLANLAKALQAKHHRITVVAPAGSTLAALAPHPPTLVEIPGTLQSTAQSDGRNAPLTLPANAVLGNMWDYARQVQGQYDLILNFAYDGLPFYLTPFFHCPIAHLVSMGSLTDAMDASIAQVVTAFPHTVAVHSRAQADTFAFGDRCRVLGNGFDLSQYHFNPTPAHHLGWVGRIAPEKGLEDALAAVQTAQLPLKIWGVVQDAPYWQQICHTYPTAASAYAGFLDTDALQQALGQCRALLMTPHWVEAFGNVAIEALACGVPVLAYRRGGPAEIVVDGKTGWLVEPDSVAGLVTAIGQIAHIDRATCRQWAEAEYSLTAMGDRLEQWFSAILAARD